MTASVSSSFVLFVDHQGHVAPFGHCYHATASRRLTSSIERHPPSTQVEIDSAYCPQCLSFHDVASASRLAYCPKASCQQCPQCQSVVNVSVMDQKCFYACGCCDWNSSAIDLHTPCTDSNQIETAAAELGNELLKRLSNEKQLEQFQATLKTLEAVALEEIRRKKQPNHILKDPSGRRPWSMDALNTSLEKKASTEGSSKGLGTLSPYASQPGAIAVTSLLLSPHQLPIPIPLRPRKSRRCVAELAEGRPGILVKPKLNPLEGDTSLRSSHGQWFKKDSSAVLVLPNVRVERLDQNAILLVVHNPTLGVVKLSFGPSTYAGEPAFENPSLRTPHLKHIIVDSLRNTVLDSITLNTSFRAPTSDMISLDAVEDVFLELGGNTVRIPQLVEEWTCDKLGWIAQQGDKAWFALDLSESECVPLSMNIVVAKGSWESSLVKSDQKDDFVTFDMVLIRTK
jgi:dynactin 4